MQMQILNANLRTGQSYLMLFGAKKQTLSLPDLHLCFLYGRLYTIPLTKSDASQSLNCLQLMEGRIGRGSVKLKAIEKELTSLQPFWSQFAVLD